MKRSAVVVQGSSMSSHVHHRPVDRRLAVAGDTANVEDNNDEVEEECIPPPVESHQLMASPTGNVIQNTYCIFQLLGTLVVFAHFRPCTRDLLILFDFCTIRD